jgi:hypothetical protein
MKENVLLHSTHFLPSAKAVLLYKKYFLKSAEAVRNADEVANGKWGIDLFELASTQKGSPADQLKLVLLVDEVANFGKGRIDLFILASNQKGSHADQLKLSLLDRSSRAVSVDDIYTKI